MAEIATRDDLRLTPAEMQANRWHYEQERLRLFPAFALLGANGYVTAAEGAIDTQYNNTYAVRIVLENYPHALPKVFPKDWTVDPRAPHHFRDGSLCIMRAAQWRQYFTVALVVAKTSIWLAKYELWKRNGHTWPGLEQQH